MKLECNEMCDESGLTERKWNSTDKASFFR
ncbi:hypothetical protein SAMN05421730_101947 [Anaerobium acetethylicum]|uniref:Uncharacterized protein n=1 Tax=Anaerobium acetethylicum TaxID=1619234 RepID=A0A1D3TW00_9FIRM|nr:hypothetical protein SAMN05421730_101947 [Anaerobium acetethylicum]